MYYVHMQRRTHTQTYNSVRNGFVPVSELRTCLINNLFLEKWVKENEVLQHFMIYVIRENERGQKQKKAA